MSTPSQPPAFKTGIVKQILSGDTIIIRRQPQGGPPPEKIIGLSGVLAPKLARQKTPNNDSETKDEPYAWEAREYLRKTLIGKEVIFTSEKPPNSSKEYGNVWAGTDPNKHENIAEALVAKGFAKIRDASKNVPQMRTLVEIEQMAKSQQKGIWGNDCHKHIRNVHSNVEYTKEFMNKFKGQAVKAIVEYVRDGSTVRLCLLPQYYSVNLMLSGIRCPGIKQDGKSDPYAEEAKFFVESRILQNDVEVLLESVNNSNFVGTITHPQGNIAELLLKYGFAKCVDWSLAIMKSGASALKAAEKQAKDDRLRIWCDFDVSTQNTAAQDKDFSATVVEICNGDAMVVKLGNGTTKKIFLSSIRPPREKNNTHNEEGNNNSPRPVGFKPLYDVPWLFEAREFLRKKLIGKRVNVSIDYVQPAKDNFPVKNCCTVMCGGCNVTEALVSKGLATVVRYRNDNDHRSPHYYKLIEAESAAQKAAVGLHAKKYIPTHRIQDTSGDPGKAKRFFPFLNRARKTEATVEFVTSGSRMRLFIHKESVLVTFLLAGINCPRGARPNTNAGPSQEAEPFGEEALQFTKEKCFQRDVIVSIEDIDRAGSFIGWLWVDNDNMSVKLIEQGLATMHHTAETTEYARVLKAGEENAKKNRIGLWKNYAEKQAEKKTVYRERVVKYQNIVVSAVTDEGNFFTQPGNITSELETLMESLHVDFKTKDSGSPFVPKKGQLCAACYTLDKQWYRARVEKVYENKEAQVFYIDYGNKEILDFSKLAPLPPGADIKPPYAQEYSLICIKFPRDEDERAEAVRVFSMEALNKKLLLNVETRSSPPAATLIDLDGNGDIGKHLIKEGLVLMDYIREQRLIPLMNEYRLAQEHAKTSRLNLWRHGDITDDDAIEFGARR